MTRSSIGVNLTWCVPGGVGGSEQYLVRQVLGLVEIGAPYDLTVYAPRGFAAAHPDVAAAVRTVEAPSDCRSRALRVALENAWLAPRTRRFAPPPPVRLQREADAPSGTTTVRFVVTRTPPGTMPEGRIQFCGHQTPEGVWQTRWLEHANRAAALRRVFLVLADPAEAATRYARYAGLPSGLVFGPAGTEFVQQTARGALHLMDAAALRARFDPDGSMAMPAPPWIAGYELASDDLSTTRAVIEGGGTPVLELPDGRLRVLLPPELGGFILFSARSPA